MKIERDQNTMQPDDFNGLTFDEIKNIIFRPFSEQCVVEINKLTKEQYEKIPLVRQTLFLLETLGKTELKLTKLGWLPLKIVAEMYRIGQPEWVIEYFQQKRINEYEAHSVEAARMILELLKWVKTRKGMLSLTAKGKKALTDVDSAVSEILLYSLIGVGLHTFDGVKDDRIGNMGTAYRVWLLNNMARRGIPAISIRSITGKYSTIRTTTTSIGNASSAVCSIGSG